LLADIIICISIDIGVISRSGNAGAGFVQAFFFGPFAVISILTRYFCTRNIQCAIL